MHLTDADVARYHRDGYVLVPDVLSPAEVRTLLAAVEGGGRVAGAARDVSGTGEMRTRLAIWHELGDDVWAAASTHPRVVNSVRILLGEEAAFFHGKVILKQPGSGGGWEWHQDYGYWYEYEQFAFPRLLSAFVALDPATRENGCLEVLRGSHRLGRLDHGRVAGQTGVDAERIGRVEPLFERVHCEMTPGSVLYFHCNLLHGSGQNRSPKPRRSFIICYNALANPRLNPAGGRLEERPCPVSDEDAILRFAPAGVA